MVSPELTELQCVPGTPMVSPELQWCPRNSSLHEFAQAVRYGVPGTPKQLGMVSPELLCPRNSYGTPMVSPELHGVPGTPPSTSSPKQLGMVSPELKQLGMVSPELVPGTQLGMVSPELLSPELRPRFSRPTALAVGRKLGSFFLLDSAFIRSKSQSAND